MNDESGALAPLNALVGEWKFAASIDARTLGTGRTTFDWREGGRFLAQYADGDASEDAAREWTENSPLPVRAVLGVDDTTGRMVQLYADARGVFRIYEMSLADGVWKVWRDAPGFFQRFTGTFSDDSRTIEGRWEASDDGVAWRHDFDLTYTKVS